MPKVYDDYLEENAGRLDITPSMFREATDRYKAVAGYLSRQGVHADFYPDGSFATGTVVRPYSKDKDAFFDLDVVGRCVDVRVEETTPEEVRSSFEDTLMSSDRYAPMIESFDECLTISYSSENRDGFKLDVVPSVPEDKDEPGDPIAIARRDSGWLSSNPRGLAEWFKDINQRFAVASSEVFRRKLFEQYGDIYGKIEDVPDDMLRTSLQRAVQVLKRSRDVYCHEARVDLQMPSCAIMVLAATIARDSDPMTGISALLEVIVSALVRSIAAGFANAFGLIGCSGDWHLANPVSDGNIVEWSDDGVRKILRWLKSVQAHLQTSPSTSSSAFNASMRSMFGEKAVLADDHREPSMTIVVPTRPWGHR